MNRGECERNMAITILLMAVALCLLECARELTRFRVTSYKIPSQVQKKEGKGLRIVFLSDLHNHVYGDRNDSLIRAVADQKPDLILIGGDMLIARPGKPWQAAAEFVRQLPSICPVYYANGNHEYRMKMHPGKYGDEYRRYKQYLEKSGVIFLENNSVKFEILDFPVQIHGLEIPEKYYEKLQKNEMSPDVVSKCIGKPDPEYFQIVLAHNPEYFDAYRRWGAKVVLSGHLHGGVARIPGYRGVISTQGNLFPEYSGEITEKDGAYMVVSKGLGTHTVNLRFLNMAEAVVLTIGTRK